MAFSPDCRLLASLADDTLQVWDARTGSSVLSVPVEGSLARCAWSPDRRQIACAGRNGFHLFELRGFEP
jgi:WD40 repeat protein